MEWHEETFKALSAPFPRDSIEWRISQSGVTKDNKLWAIVLPYINARSAMDRLDAVLGWDKWSEKITPIDGGFLHELTIKLPDGSTVTKMDGAPKTNFEEIKGGISDSFKRVVVKVGVGRYLYGLDKTYFAVIKPEGEKGQHRDKVKLKEGGERWFYWDEPEI